MIATALGLTAPDGRDPALQASTPAILRANASASWLRQEFSTQTKSTETCRAMLSRRRLVLGMVADVLAEHHEDRVLGDVGGVVGDALQVAGDQDEAQGPLDRRGVRLHELHELVEGVAL